jgi:L-cysteine S-thiosulfotransferase
VIRGLGVAMLGTVASIAVAIAEPLTSAREFLPPELQAQQADDGANPGMLWVTRGQTLWSQPTGPAAKSCVECHGDAMASMRGVAARYPAVDAGTGRLMNLEARINNCRVANMGAGPLAYETDDLLGLAAYVAHQSRGLPLSVRTDGTAAPHVEAGRHFFFERQGQLNLSCSQCHDDQVGRRLRGDRISSGLPTGYPVYRLDWQKMGSLQRRLRACALGVRAELLDAGSPEYLNLELYLAARAGGVAIETPAVRK